MKASEYIEKLKTLIEKYGDLDCIDSFGNTTESPEFNDDEDPPVFIID